jgi:prolipoprotein diacylglyceryltransferase
MKLFTANHWKSARGAFITGGVFAGFGLISFFVPGVERESSRGITGLLGLPIWVISAFLLALGLFVMFLAFLQRRREKRGDGTGSGA